jgi:hypothetical protein
MPLIFMTIGTDLDIGLMAEKVGIVGAVRSVAGDAVPLQHRLVLGLGLLLPGHDTGVTASAEVQRRFTQKLWLFRGMRIVTRQAPLLTQNRPVDVGISECCINRLFVTLAARLNVPPGRRYRAGSRVALVALTAHSLRNRAVDIVLEDSGLVGTVGIVASGADRRGHRVSQMALGEIGIGGVMAIETQVRLASRQ